MKNLALVLLLLILGTAAGVHAQKSGIKGFVADQNGAEIEKVQVTATGKDNRHFSTATNGNGHYDLSLEPGTYTIEFTGPGFLKTKVLNYEIPPNIWMTLDIILDVDMDASGAIYTEIRCDTSGKCSVIDRLGMGTTKPKEITIVHAEADGKYYDLVEAPNIQTTNTVPSAQVGARPLQPLVTDKSKAKAKKKKP
jgi:hypothetical protein